MASPERMKGYWIADLTDAKRQVLDVMRCEAPEPGLSSREIAWRTNLARADYATARLQVLVKRGFIFRYEKDVDAGCVLRRPMRKGSRWLKSS